MEGRMDTDRGCAGSSARARVGWALLIGVIGAGLCVCGPAAGQEETVDAPLRIGTKEVPPFAMKRADGSWHGISIALLRKVSLELGFEYELVERPIEALITDVESGALDASIAAITVTADREAKVDFTHPYHTSGLGIAVRTEGQSGWSSVVNRVFSLDFMAGLLALGGILLLAGIGIWIFERRKNDEQFGGGVVRGLGSGFWWSAVTMTTVGYGDKAPVTPGGRIVALVWMFASIITISGFTAAIATTLTIGGLSGKVGGPQDLPGVKVAVVGGTTGDAYVRRVGGKRVEYATPDACLEALGAGEVAAVVYDAPILRYLVLGSDADLRVLPGTFTREDYAMATPLDSPLRKELNRAILATVSAADWKAILHEFLGG